MPRAFLSLLSLLLSAVAFSYLAVLVVYAYLPPPPMALLLGMVFAAALASPPGLGDLLEAVDAVKASQPRLRRRAAAAPPERLEDLWQDIADYNPRVDGDSVVLEVKGTRVRLPHPARLGDEEREMLAEMLKGLKRNPDYVLYLLNTWGYVDGGVGEGGGV